MSAAAGSFRASPAFDRSDMYEAIAKVDNEPMAARASRIRLLLLPMALPIADEAARSDIELYAPEVKRDGLIWYDTAPEALAAKFGDPFMTESIPRNLQYLKLRGLVRLHPDAPHLVRF